MLELLVVIAIVGVLAAMSGPWLIAYWHSAKLKAAAEELAAGLNRARQLAISLNQRVCVQIVGNRYVYWLNNCEETAWAGLGSDSTGAFRLANDVAVTANANPVFDYLGAANPGATLTVTHPKVAVTLAVVVSVAGRVRVCPAGGCAP